MQMWCLTMSQQHLHHDDDGTQPQCDAYRHTVLLTYIVTYLYGAVNSSPFSTSFVVKHWKCVDSLLVKQSVLRSDGIAVLNMSATGTKAEPDSHLPYKRCEMI